MKSGVQQELSFSLDLLAGYVNELITQLRQTLYGLRIGHVSPGCAFYAYDNALLFASYYGLQRLFSVCKQYDIKWDISFKPIKS